MTRAQIVATIGPSSEKPGIMCEIIAGGMDIARLNFAWIDEARAVQQIDATRAAAVECGMKAPPIIADLPGPRVQLQSGHTYDASLASTLTPQDEATLALCAQKNVERGASAIRHCSGRALWGFTQRERKSRRGDGF